MMDSFRTYFFLFLTIGALAGCQDDDADMSPADTDLFEQQQQTIEQYLTERGIATQQNEAGIHFQVLTENESGASPEPGQIVNLYYRIEELEGGLIEAREESSGSAPASYIFNDQFLLAPRGLNVMLSQMREGEEHEFYLPSRWAYLDYSQPGVISSNAIVRARIKLVEALTPNEQKQVEDERIKDYLASNQLEDADSLASGVYYVQRQAGDTSAMVNNTSTVSLRYTGSLLDGTVFDTNTEAGDQPLEFTIGQTSLIEGFLTGVLQMSLGEKGTVIIPSHAAYGPGAVAIPYSIVKDWLEQGATPQRIPPFAILRFDLEVIAVN